MTKYSYACTANEYRPRMVLGNNARNSYACTSKRQRTSPTLTLFHSKEKIRTKCYSTAPRNLQTTMPLSPIVAQWHQHVIEPPANYLAEYNKALVPEPVQPRQHIAVHTLSIKADSAHSDHNSDVRKIASRKMKFL